MTPEQMRERYRPVDSQTRNPAAPYRCAEMRDDVDRVLLGRAHPDVAERYHAHRAGCTSCQSFHRNMRALYEGPGRGPTRLEQEAEFQSILERARREAEPETPQRRLMWLAPVAAASAMLLKGSQSTLTPNGTEIPLLNFPMTYAIVAVEARSTSNSYGLSFSLPNITASKPAA